MELGWFRKAPIADVLEANFVEARLHTDGEEHIDQILQLQEEYVGDVGLPNYIIVDPTDLKKHGRYKDGAALTLSDAQKFTDFLKESLAKFKS